MAHKPKVYAKRYNKNNMIPLPAPPPDAPDPNKRGRGRPRKDTLNVPGQSLLLDLASARTEPAPDGAPEAATSHDSH